MLRRSLRELGWKKKKKSVFCCFNFHLRHNRRRKLAFELRWKQKSDEGDGLRSRGGSKFSSRNYLHGGNGLRHKIDFEQFLMKAKARQKTLRLEREREVLSLG